MTKFKFKSDKLKPIGLQSPRDVNELMLDALYDLFGETNTYIGYVPWSTYARVIRWSVEYIGYHLDNKSCHRAEWMAVLNLLTVDYLKRFPEHITNDDYTISSDDMSDLCDIICKTVKTI